MKVFSITSTKKRDDMKAGTNIYDKVNQRDKNDIPEKPVIYTYKSVFPFMNDLSILMKENATVIGKVTV